MNSYMKIILIIINSTFQIYQQIKKIQAIFVIINMHMQLMNIYKLYKYDKGFMIWKI